MQSWHDGLPTETPSPHALPLPKRRHVRPHGEEAPRMETASDSSEFGESANRQLQLGS